MPSSWGKYRRTMAQAVPGDGNRRAVFTADLPTRAGWRLDFHVPDDPLPDLPGDTFADFVDPPFTDQLGGYDMWLRTVSGDRVIEFDGSGAIPGWNKIGLFELDPGPVSVVVSNRTTGDIVTDRGPRRRVVRGVGRPCRFPDGLVRVGTGRRKGGGFCGASASAPPPGRR